MAALATVEKTENSETTTSYPGLDAAPEKVFDDLAWLTAQVCCVPMAIVTVSSSRGQRIKSKVGLTAQEAARELTICEPTLAQRGVHVVKDALLDPQFAHDPMVTGSPKLRFFAGMPLITSDGHPVGTLLVMDRVPRQLSPEQSYALEVLARQLVNQLEWRKQASSVPK
jgi:GAF domain-containing protein